MVNRPEGWPGNGEGQQKLSQKKRNESERGKKSPIKSKVRRRFFSLLVLLRSLYKRRGEGERERAYVWRKYNEGKRERKGGLKKGEWR